MIKKNKLKYFILSFTTAIILGFAIICSLGNNNELKIEQMEVENNEMKEKELEKNSLDKSNNKDGLNAYLINGKDKKIIWLRVSTGNSSPPPENITVEEKGREILIKVKKTENENIFTAKQSYFYKIVVNSKVKKIKVLVE